MTLLRDILSALVFFGLGCAGGITLALVIDRHNRMDR